MSVSLLLQDSPDFELVRKRLHAAGFNEESICARLGIPDLGEFSRNPRNHTVPTEPDELSLLTRLLVLGETLNRDELEATVSSRVVAAMTNLGLLSVDADAGRLCCSLRPLPCRGHPHRIGPMDAARWQGIRSARRFRLSRHRSQHPRISGRTPRDALRPLRGAVLGSGSGGVGGFAVLPPCLGS